MIENDPLWKLRHALASLALALLLAVLTAAALGAYGADGLARLLAQTPGYGARVTAYGLLLLYVLAGAVVLFVKVARFETRPVSVGRVLLWWLSLWAWPALVLRARRPPSDPASGPPPGDR
jgi:hypothetical protein